MVSSTRVAAIHCVTEQHQAWGLAMAAKHMRLDPASYSIEVFKILVVAFLQRSYGCTINDICDYELDRKVGEY
jgi:4-hydroxybenzoate polyprenyltransferase